MARLQTGCFSWALVACTALVVLSGVECGDSPSQAELGPTLATSTSGVLRDDLGDVAKVAGDDFARLTVVAPPDLIQSGKKLICEGWAKMGHCKTTALVQQKCAASCAAAQPAGLKEDAELKKLKAELQKQRQKAMQDQQKLKAQKAELEKLKAEQSKKKASNPLATTQQAAKLKAQVVSSGMNASNASNASCPAALHKCLTKAGETGLGLVIKKQNDAFVKAVQQKLEMTKGAGFRCEKKGKSKGRKMGMKKSRCTFDGVSDECGFGVKKRKGFRKGKGKANGKGNGVGSEGLTSGVKRCNKFWKSAFVGPEGFRMGDRTYKKPLFVCQATKISSALGQAGRGRGPGGEEFSLAALDRELEQDLGEVSQVSVGRRGKASTVRRGGGSYVMPMSSSGGSSFQGNFEEEEELGEGRRGASAAIASSTEVQGLGVCTEDLEAEDLEALRKEGPTCVAAYVANQMVKKGLYEEGNDARVCGRGKRKGKGSGRVLLQFGGKKVAPEGDGCGAAKAWRKANEIKLPKLCIAAAKRAKCRPPLNVHEGSLLKAQCMGALVAM